MTDYPLESTASGFTPVYDVIASDPKLGTIAAVVFGQVWRHCQMRRGVCDASRETMASETGLSKKTYDRWLPVLCERGYLKDLTPEAKHKTHVYADTGKVRMIVRVEAGLADPEEIGQKVAPEKRGWTFCPTRLDRESHKEIMKKENHEEEDQDLIQDLDLIEIAPKEAGRVIKREGQERARLALALTLDKRADKPKKYFYGCLRGPELMPLQEGEIDRIIVRARVCEQAPTPRYANDRDPGDVDELPEPIPIPGLGLDARPVWGQALAELRGMMTGATFSRWLGGAEVLSAREGVLQIGVRGPYEADWLGARWAKRIGDLVGHIAGGSLEVCFVPIEAGIG